MQSGIAEQMVSSQMPLTPQNGQSSARFSSFQSCRPQELTPQVAAAYHCLPYRSLRSRRTRQAANLPPYLRRRFDMEDNSWIQSISDFEEDPQAARLMLHDASKEDFAGDDHGSQARLEDHIMSDDDSLWNSSSFYGPMRPSTLTNAMSCNNPVWASQSASFHSDIGVSAASTSAAIPQTLFSASFPPANLPLSATSSCPPYLLSLQDEAVAQTTGFNPPSQAHAAFAGLRSESMLVNRDQSTARPNLRIDTSTHNYFKENSGAILAKWFSDAVNPVEPPQLYHVPPPPSLASQESSDDMMSVSSYPKSQTPPTSHPQTASDVSSHLSFAEFPTDYGMHANVAQGVVTRSRRPLPSAPVCSSSNASSLNSASGYSRSSSSPEEETENFDGDDNYQDSDEADQYDENSYNSASPNSARMRKDNFLITARRAGMTYRDIKVKGEFIEAESTLRGRFRTLTKHRAARVRKPNWTEKDIVLLRRGVRKCCKDRDPDDVKIPWKTVAKYIDENGGSYLFGNATCRKKWDELNEE